MVAAPEPGPRRQAERRPHPNPRSLPSEQAPSSPSCHLRKRWGVEGSLGEATGLRPPNLADRSETALRDGWRALTIYGESLGSAGLSDALGSPRMQNGPRLNRETRLGKPRNRSRGPREDRGEPRISRKRLFPPRGPKIRAEPRNRGRRLGHPRNPPPEGRGVPRGDQ